jgi:hypothetical protein
MQIVEAVNNSNSIKVYEQIRIKHSFDCSEVPSELAQTHEMNE